MAGVNALIQRLERLGAAEVKAKITSKVRDVMHAECIRGFNEQRDPYGVAWQPRKPLKGWAAMAFGLLQDNHPLLNKTGAMIRSLTARATSNGVVMRIIGYAKFHQSGTSKMVARKIFPDPGRGLGLWSEPVHRAAVDAVKEMMH